MAEDRSKPSFHQDIHVEIRAPFVEGLDQRQGQYGITEGPQANEQEARDALQDPANMLGVCRIRFPECTLGMRTLYLGQDRCSLEKCSRRNAEKLLTLLDPGFVDEHDGNIVANRIYAATLHALEPVLLGGQPDFLLAQGTGKNRQQFLADCHAHLLPAQNITTGG
jgi:hypothetical protein